MLNHRLLPKLIVYLESHFNFAGEKINFDINKKGLLEPSSFQQNNGTHKCTLYF